jgi:hypothetical protein
LSEFLTICTIHSCTSVCGNTALIASGNPVKNGWFWFGWNGFLRGDYLDGIVIKVRQDKQIIKKTMYIALGVN